MTSTWLPEAQQQVLAAFVFAGLALLGWGALFRRLCGYELRTADDLFGACCEGWAFLLGALQIWHFLAAIDARATIAATAVGAVGLLWTGPAWAGGFRRVARSLPALALILVAAVWLAGFALGGPRHGDAGGYYIPTTIWMHEFPVVTGLGNLSAPYAYNISYFLYAALASVGPFADRPWHVVNATVLMIVLARGLVGCWRLVSPWHRVEWNDLAYAFLLPGAIALVLGIFLTSMAPDTGIYFIGAGLLGSLIHVASSDARAARFHLLAVMLFLCAGWTIKVSFAGMAGALAVVAPLGWWWRFRPGVRECGAVLLRLAVIGAFMVGPWLGSNVMMSGMPFFPSAFGAFDVPWKVQLDVQKWIESDKNVGPLSLLWQNPTWYLQRLDGYGWSEREVALPLVVAAVALPLVVLGALWTRRGRRRSATALPWWIVVPPLVALAFALRLTPMPRYAGATMWLCAITTVLVAIGGWLRQSAVGRALALAAVVAGTAFLAAPAGALWPTLRDYEGLGRPQIETRVLASGLTVYFPAHDACFAAPLPCTPNLDPRLALRVPGDLGSGFYIVDAP
ncbi:MAG: hypothetical protein ABIR79_07625 [Candidatus Binatia bacterium]